MATVIVRSGPGLRQEIEAGTHTLVADESVAAGGTGTGPDPYMLLMAALGACTSMTLRLYAGRKGWPLRGVVVELHFARVYAEDCVDCEDPRALVERITRRITLTGDLDPSQVARLGEIARKCPVHKTLTAGLRIEDEIAVATA
jgi:putative redox protein